MIEPIFDQIVDIPGVLSLDCGVNLGSLKAAVSIYGSERAAPSETLFFGHGFSTSSRMHSWWSSFLEQVNLDRYKLICVNALGSSHGSTGPTCNSYEGGIFPQISIKDQSRFYVETIKALDIGRVGCVVGASMGGMHALQMYIDSPEVMSRCIVIGAAPLTNFTKAFNWLQLKILDDPRLNAISREATLEYCRMIMRLICVNHTAANRSVLSDFLNELEQESEKFIHRFTRESYYQLTYAMNKFEIKLDACGEKHRSIPICLVAIEDDLYVPEQSMLHLYEQFKKNNYRVSYSKFMTSKGHESWITDGANFGKFLAQVLL